MRLFCSCLLLLQVVYCEIYKNAEGVYSFTSNGGFQVSMVIVTNDGVIVIDPMNVQHSEQMLREIRSITDQPVKLVFYSHNHWDHAGGGQVFKDVGATIMAHQEAYKWLQSNPGPDVVLPDLIWSGEQSDVRLGGTLVQRHYFGSSHGLGMNAFVLPGVRVAFIADNVTPNRVGFMFLPDFDIDGWMRTLGKLGKLDFDTAIFSHTHNPEPLKGGDKEDVEEMRQYVQDIRDGIKSELGKGTNPFVIPSTLKLPKYQNWANYEEWLPLNIWAIMLQDNLMGPYSKHSVP